jgi:hypothetical protein
MEIYVVAVCVWLADMLATKVSWKWMNKQLSKVAQRELL